MKLLVASVGDTLNSLVAKHFEHAAWYLFVDTETLAVDPAQNMTPNDDHNALKRAAAQNVRTVVAGKFTPRSLKRMGDAKQRAALVHGIPVRQLIGKIRSGEIVPEELTVDSARETTTLPRSVPSKNRKRARVALGFSSDSPRGHHHIQQYAGRGH